MVSMQDIADKAGVSRVTVSRVLSNHPSVKAETRQKVLYWVKELDYEPNLIAQSLAGNRTNIIGLLVPEQAAQTARLAIPGRLRRTHAFHPLRQHGRQGRIQRADQDARAAYHDKTHQKKEDTLQYFQVSTHSAALRLKQSIGQQAQSRCAAHDISSSTLSYTYTV